MKTLSKSKVRKETTQLSIRTFKACGCGISIKILSRNTQENNNEIRIIMVETGKKSKCNSAEVPSKTFIYRGNIDANWQKLVSSKLMTESKNDKQGENKKPIYTGTYRRARKSKESNQTNSNNVNDEIVKNGDSKGSNLEQENRPQSSSKSNDSRKNKSITKFIAMDCEMVGIGNNGEDNMVARVSLVNKFGDCIYDKFVKPREEVKDYRTQISGIRREDLLNGTDFATVQREVSEILKGKVLVGHSIRYDLAVLFLSHPKRNIRDTSKYKPFRAVTKGHTPSLKLLAKEFLGIDIQGGEHSSVEDAKAAMQLYCMVSKAWDRMMSEKRGGSRMVYE